jgi:hypothetical protein
MGQVRNAKRANAKTHVIPKSGKRAGVSSHHHEHADGRAHHHAGGRDPHQHKTSAERFAERYPDGAPFGSKDNGQLPDEPDAPDAPAARDGAPMRYVVAAVLMAMIGGLALIAIFTPTGETLPTSELLPATARDVVYTRPLADATATVTPTATPNATPCPGPTLPYCEAPPTEQARPDTGAPTATTPTLYTSETSSVGGALVPDGLHCQEDEIIGFVAVDTLGCVHVEGLTLEP